MTAVTNSFTNVRGRNSTEYVRDRALKQFNISAPCRKISGK